MENTIDAETVLPERLQAVRKSDNLTQAEFAKKIGVPPRALTNYELALRGIPLSVLTSVHKNFGPDFIWLAIGTGLSNSESPSDVATRAAKTIKSFELKQNTQLSPEKMAMVTKYLFKKIPATEPTRRLKCMNTSKP